MSKRLTLKGPQVAFPAGCLICQQPIEKKYDISRTFAFGNRSHTVTLPIALCAKHFAMASKKNATEQMIGRTGLILGFVIGIAIAAGLLVYWSNSAQGNLILNLFMAAVTGVGFGLIIWALLTFFIAPNFADPDSKMVRHAMQIRHFWPNSQDLQLEFADDAVAQRVANVNPDRLIKME